MKVVYLQEAKDDMKSIWQYIAKENVDAAEMVVGGIHKQILLVADFPNIGKKYPYKAGNIRNMLAGSHIVF